MNKSCEMGTWFLEKANVRHLCQDKGYNYARVSEEVYINGFEGISAAAKKRGVARSASDPVLGNGTDLCLAEGLP